MAAARRAPGLLLLLLLATPAGAHDALSSLASWGNFGAATPCMRVISAAAARCAAAAITARRACNDARLSGGTCEAAAVDAAVRAARGAALDTVQAVCSEEQAAALKASGVFDLLADTVRACRALEQGVIEAVYAPVTRADGSVREGTAAERACVGATAGAAAKLAASAAGIWRRTFDHLAGRDLTLEQKDALAARAAARVRRARVAVERMLAARCAPAAFAPLYGQSAAQLLAGVGQAGGCFAEGVYQQEAVTCAQTSAAAIPGAACVDNLAGGYPCRNVDLLAFLPLASIGGGDGNDVWGWTDPLTGREYALMGRSSGTAFIDVTTPTQPIYLGNLPTHSVNSLWRGIKVYANHAFIVSEAATHGMQVFDLTQLRDFAGLPLTYTETAHYAGFSNCHTLALNEATGFAYAAGTNTCSAGVHIVDVRDPLHPVLAGCTPNDGYTHETQCVSYHGPDAAYAGRELCFSSNTDTLTIADVTTKGATVQVSRTGYSGRGYTHQGWLTDDHAYFLMDDELDELNFGHNTRTLIWDVRDVDAPSVIGAYLGPTTATDHNLYIKGGYAYESNYRAGLRILDLAGVASASLTEAAYFDVVPASNAAGFAGTWSNYPFFASGTVLVGGIESGLFILQPQLGGESSPTPTVGTPTMTGTATATRTPSATRTTTPTRTMTPTRTVTPIPVIVLDPLPVPIVVGASLALSGSGFTPGSVAMLFVATSAGAVSAGPLVPSQRTSTALSVLIPASVPLGNGFASVMIVNTDQGFAQSNVQSQLLFGAAAANIPSLTSINGVAQMPLDPGIPTAFVPTVLVPGATITLGGSGFNAPKVNLFSVDGNLGPLDPLPGGSASALQLVVPPGAPTGPAAVQVVNAPFGGNVASNAVATALGAAIGVDAVAQNGAVVTVTGSGFCAATVINLFNAQGGGVVNLGGLSGGGANVPLTIVSPHQFTFTVPAGAVGGPAYVQALNPPFISLSSSGNDPDGAFTIQAP